MNCRLALPDGSAAIGQWLYDWQTLISGILALIAALLAGYLIHRQIRQSEYFNRDQIYRSHNAARVILPLALDEIGVTCSEIANVLIPELEAILGEGTLDAELVRDCSGRTNFPQIQVSGEALAAMQGFVATLTRPGDVRHTAELVSHVQILLARYRNFDFQQVVIEEGMFDLLLDAGKVMCLLSAMFNYARFVEDTEFGIVGSVPLDEIWDKIRHATHGLIFHSSHRYLLSCPIDARVRRYKELNISPWNEKFEE